MIATAHRVAGLAVVDLAMLRQHVAAQPVSDATSLRLRPIDRELGVGSGAGGSASGIRSAGGWAHLHGVLRAPSVAFGAHRGSSLWWPAYAVACVAVFLSTLGDVMHGEPAHLLVRVPIMAGIALLIQRLVTGVARWVCGGYPELGGPTASQAAIVTSMTTIPVALVDLLPIPLLTLAVAGRLPQLLAGSDSVRREILHKLANSGSRGAGPHACGPPCTAGNSVGSVRGGT